MSEPWTVVRILEWTAGYFREQGVDSPRLDAELLLADLLALDRVGLYLQYDRPLSPDELGAYRALVKRRAQREPLAYILGRTEFWSLPLRVTPDVLVPRGDTEVLVEEALARLENGGRLLDIGTGSGAIAIAIAHERPQLQVEAIDVSAAALQVAAANAKLNGVAERIVFRQEDLARLSGGGYDLIVSNPPYIAEGERDDLMPEVREHEPALALFAGEDGLAAYRQIVAQAPTLLAPHGWLLLELGIGQSDAVVALMRSAGFDAITVRDDYAGIPRVACGRKQG